LWDAIRNARVSRRLPSRSHHAIRRALRLPAFSLETGWGTARGVVRMATADLSLLTQVTLRLQRGGPSAGSAGTARECARLPASNSRRR
jgi:hypothetical protein